MKILHAMLSCFYIDCYNYQENTLPKIMNDLGHDVLIVASTEILCENNQVEYLEASRYNNEFGIPVIRVPYKKIINNRLTHKIRAYKGVYEIIENFCPDFIMFHGSSAYELNTFIKYVKNHPNVRFILDSHASMTNSGTNWISRNILHKRFYKPILNKALPYLEKVYYIGTSEADFLKKIYRIPDSKLELFPLGDSIFDDQEYYKQRKKIREELGYKDDDIVLYHTGKLDRNKKTLEIINAVVSANQKNIKLCIVGGMTEDVSLVVMQKIEEYHNKIRYLGWMNSTNLKKYLCAADAYVQFSYSSTFQTALCCRCIGITTDPSNGYDYIPDSIIFYIMTRDDLVKIIEKIGKGEIDINKQKELSYAYAKESLDYNRLVKKILS
ncbi:glycosyltransferase [uncultured Sphaerochaeta sp.]|uniref:glycosyltransferase n=1 Tax=uncultured Sphaerochaeta sp. TaxID=886478 RepID=UPI002A0A32B1|nr:glycosyltransferase [uncultured Sphaerochaeta sp.]